MAGADKCPAFRAILILTTSAKDVLTTLCGVLLYVYDAVLDGRRLAMKMIQDIIWVLKD